MTNEKNVLVTQKAFRVVTLSLFWFSIAFCLSDRPVYGQDKTLPYYQLPAFPKNYSAGGIASRMIDGLGFRFFWATEGLRSEDLAFKPGEDARTSRETLEHIYEMSFMILNSTTGTVNGDHDLSIPFDELRKKTLQNLKAASDNIRLKSDKEMKKSVAKFKTGDQIIELPFWNLVNGPIEDCIWHVGQVVSFRRSSGNPFTENLNLFTGTVN